MRVDLLKNLSVILFTAIPSPILSTRVASVAIIHSDSQTFVGLRPQLSQALIDYVSMSTLPRRCIIIIVSNPVCSKNYPVYYPIPNTRETKHKN